MPHPDDRRIAVASRTLRRKAGKRQVDAIPTGRSRRLVLDIERGEAAALRVGDLRDYFRQFDAGLRITVYWNGAALDRTIDEQHAGIAEGAIAELRRLGWATDAEVSFNEFGERGSIDILATNQLAVAAVVGEVKSEWGSIEETNRALDMKARLAPRICFARFGWRPLRVAKVLILPEVGSARRVVARYRQTLDAVYPARTREVRRWLRRPEGPLAGIWFLSQVTPP